MIKINETISIYDNKKEPLLYYVSKDIKHKVKDLLLIVFVSYPHINTLRNTVFLNSKFPSPLC